VKQYLSENSAKYKFIYSKLKKKMQTNKHVK